MYIAYCTGLLCARRLLTKVGLADKYVGVEEADGEFYEVEPLEDGPRPFKCYLDVGLKRTTTGAKVFAAMKGASDGGLYIPHSERRFPGFDTLEKKLDTEVLRDYIYGQQICEYMQELEEDDEEVFKKQFAKYLEAGVSADDLEEMYSNAHKAIRANPLPEKKEHSPEEIAKFKLAVKKTKKTKLNLKQRRDKVKQKKAAFLRSMGVETA